MSYSRWFPKLPDDITKEQFMEHVKNTRSKTAYENWLVIFRDGLVRPVIKVSSTFIDIVNQIRVRRVKE
jgi:hypothetical protein